MGFGIVIGLWLDWCPLLGGYWIARPAGREAIVRLQAPILFSLTWD